MVEENTLKHKIDRVVLRDSINKLGEDMEVDLPGVDAYARRLTKRLIPKEFFQKIKKQLRAAVYSTTRACKFGVVTSDYKPDKLDWLNAQQNGSLRGQHFGLKVVLSRTFGIPLIAINADTTAISKRLHEEKGIDKAIRILL